jgi:hypothetical protein
MKAGIKMTELTYLKRGIFEEFNFESSLRLAINEMNVNPDREDAIIQFYTTSANGQFILKALGDTLDVKELQERNPEEEGYWDWWIYTVQPKMDEDLEVICRELGFNLDKEGYTITIDYTENGDIAAILHRKEEVSDDQYGYLESGEPTDAQIQLQDELDGITQQYIQTLYNIHARVSQLEEKEIPHDIHVLTHTREEAERLLGLKDIY